jgi:hypothetical protein
VWNAPAREDNWIEVRFDTPILAERVAVFEGMESPRNFSASDRTPVHLEVETAGNWKTLGAMRTDPNLRGHFAEFDRTTISALRLTNGQGTNTSPWSIRDMFVFPGTP